MPWSFPVISPPPSTLTPTTRSLPTSGPAPCPPWPPEFHFPAEEPWWDEYDCNHDMSDSFGSCDSLSDSVSDFDLHEDLNIYFNSTLYHISPQEDDFDLYHTHTTLFTTLRRPSSCVFFPYYTPTQTVKKTVSSRLHIISHLHYVTFMRTLSRTN